MSEASKKKKVFDNRYEVLSIVGRGARSVVYHARYIDGEQEEVALKVLLERKEGPPPSDLLRKEALAMVSSRHKYVIRLDDFHSLGEICYLTMEYAQLGDLRKYLNNKKGKLTATQTELFLLQAAEALDFIHKAGILHRDLKPDNILVADDQNIRIGDFGVAILPGEKSSLEELQKGIGTLDYLPQEILQGAQYDRRADLYALGVTFYEILSGIHPFEKVPLAKQVEAREHGNFTSIVKREPDAPGHLLSAINKLMSFDPDNRFQNPRELIQALVSFDVSGLEDPPPASSTPTTKAAHVESEPIEPLIEDPFPVEAESKPPKEDDEDDTEAFLETEEPDESILDDDEDDDLFLEPEELLPEDEPEDTPPLADPTEDIEDLEDPDELFGMPEDTAEAAPKEEEPTPPPFESEPAPEETTKPEAIEPPPSVEEPVAPEPIAQTPPTQEIPPVEPTPVAPPEQPQAVQQPTPPPTEQTTISNEDFNKQMEQQAPPQPEAPQQQPTAQQSPPQQPTQEQTTQHTTMSMGGSTSTAIQGSSYITLVAIVAGAVGLFIITQYLFSCGSDDEVIPNSGIEVIQPGQQQIDDGKIFPESTNNTQPTSFPAIPGGLYSGNAVFKSSNEQVPFSLISVESNAQLIMAIGIPGFSPITIDLNDYAGSDTGEIQVIAQGMRLSISGRAENGTLNGTIVLQTSGETLQWTARKS